MNLKKYSISTVVVFLFVMAYDMAVHGGVLKEVYDATKEVWRPEDEHNMVVMFLSMFLYAVVFCFIYTRKNENKGLGEGIRFGLMMGGLVGTIKLATYCYLPIPFSLTAVWVLSEVLKGIGAGIILTFTYKS